MCILALSCWVTPRTIRDIRDTNLCTIYDINLDLFTWAFNTGIHLFSAHNSNLRNLKPKIAILHFRPKLQTKMIFMCFPVKKYGMFHGNAAFRFLANSSSFFNPSSGEPDSPSCLTIALPTITPSAPHPAICINTQNRSKKVVKVCADKGG